MENSQELFSLSIFFFPPRSNLLVVVLVRIAFCKRTPLVRFTVSLPALRIFSPLPRRTHKARGRSTRLPVLRPGDTLV